MARSSLIVTATAFAVGAVAATAVSLFALSSIGTGLGQTQNLAGAPLPTASTTTFSSESASPSQPAATSSTGVTPTASAHPGPATTASSDTAAGLVSATCRDGGAYLVSWSPKPGYRVDGLLRGPAPSASIKFEGLAGEIIATAKCYNGAPVITVHEDSHGTGTHE